MTGFFYIFDLDMDLFKIAKLWMKKSKTSLIKHIQKKIIALTDNTILVLHLHVVL